MSNVGEPDLSGLYIYDLEKDEMTLVESDPENEVDIQNVSFSQLTDEIIATIYLADKKRIYWKNKSYESDYNFLKSKYPNSEIGITSETKDESKWLFYVNGDTDPGKAYMYDRKTKSITYLYTPRPELPTEHLVSMTPVRYNSSDGLSIPAYLTLPDNQDNKNLPGIVLVHGGPWARDYWGYNSFAQFLANRGYAVIQPNFRGSTGYGKKFLNAAINQWGEKMQDDLTYAAQYLIENKYCKSDKIAIMGGSYGGYATLAGLTFTPEVYAAGVSIVGPSNLFTLLDTIPPYWESARVMFHKRMGNPTTEEGREQLKRQSPFFHADKIKSPLLVAQGNNDPRVKTSESDQIVIAMRDIGLPVEYINFPDEGHGFAKPQNNMSFIAVMEKFLAKHIGGRYQKEVPESLSEIIDNVTVDISTLVMPTIISQDEKNVALPLPSKDITNGEYIYTIHLSIQGQEVNFDSKRFVIADDKNIMINDFSSSAMGDLRDDSVIKRTSGLPVSRRVEQGPLVIEFTHTNKVINGSVSMNGQDQKIDFKDENDFVMDGPSLDVYLSLIELTIDKKCLIRVFNSQSQKIELYNFFVVDETEIDGHNCNVYVLQSIENKSKKHTLWISSGQHPLLIKKESILPEMNGATMILHLKTILKSN